MTKQLVEVVSTFNGAERRVIGRARSAGGTKRLLRSAAADCGWGVRVRGTKAALEAVGAYQIDTSDTGQIAMVLPVDYRHGRAYITCSVV